MSVWARREYRKALKEMRAKGVLAIGLAADIYPSQVRHVTAALEYLNSLIENEKGLRQIKAKRE